MPFQFLRTASCRIAFHALVYGESPDSEVHGFICVFKQLTSHKFSKLSFGRLWMTSYWDRTIRGEGATVAVIRYIVTNPVKAGLVSNPLDYPFWGSDLWTRQELVDLIAKGSARGGSQDL